MSTAAKLTLAGTTVGAIGIVVLVHYQQNSEKAVSICALTNLHHIIGPSILYNHVGLTDKSYQAMHAGVIRDIEQQRVKKERQADFEMQKALEEEYRRVQTVHDDGAKG